MNIRECEDCGEEIPITERRHRCHNCNILVCGWCMNHVHVPGVPYSTANCAPTDAMKGGA